MKRSELFFSAIAVPLDFLALLAAAVVSYAIRFHPSVRDIRPVIFLLPLGEFVPWAMLAAAFGVLAFGMAGSYRITATRALGDDVAKIFLACSTSVAVVVGVMFFTRYLFESRFIILTSWILSVVFTVAVRVLLRQVQRQLYRFDIGIHRLALIGNQGVANDLRQEFSAHSAHGYRVVVQFPEFTAAVAQQLKVLATSDKIDEVVQAGVNLDRQQTLDLIELLQAHHLDYTYTADLLGTKVANFHLAIHAGVPMVEVRPTPLDGWGRIWKRLFDVVGASALIILTSPFMIAVALAIVVDSGRPVFFTYRRVGERARKFRFIKFRSMVPGAHQLRYDPAFTAQHQNLRAGTPMIKFKDDPRITRVGRFIRRWSLDELPQLFLVLGGMMSLVGPRPHEVEEVAHYGQSQRQLLFVKPGITGLAQVSGRSDLAFDEEVKLDSYYIQNWSPWLDLQILLKTPGAVLRRPQAE